MTLACRLRPVALWALLGPGLTAAESATATATALIGSGADAAAEWTSKTNTKVQIVAGTEAAAGPTLCFTIDPAEFGFGWVNRLFPESGRAGAAGIHGFCRGDRPGTLVSHVVLFEDGGEPSYFQAECGPLGEGGGEWLEFYLPFSGFTHQKGPRQGFTAAGLGTTARLQFLASLNGKEVSRVELRGPALVPATEAGPLQKRLGRLRVTRLLRPGEAVAGGPHPRLVFTSAGMADLNARLASVPELPAVRQALVARAESVVRTLRPEAPFGDLLEFGRRCMLKAQARRAAFEGQLVPKVVPIEVLGAAYRITGDSRLGRLGAEALATMASQLTVDDPVIDEGFYYTRTFYVRALAFGYDWLWDAFTPEQRREVATTLLGFALDIHRQSQTGGWGRRPLHRVWNWDPGLMGACGMAMLALEGETLTGETAILFDCRRHLRDYLTLGIDADGCCHEGPNYIGYGIGAGVDFVEALRRQGRGDLFTGSNYQLIPPWLVSETLPDGRRWNNLSDCGSGQTPWPVYAYACGRLAELAAADPAKAGEHLTADDSREPRDYLQHFREEPAVRRLSYGALAELMGWAWQRGPGRASPEQLDDLRLLGYLFYYRPCPVAADPAAYLPLGLHFRGRGLVVCRTGFGPDDWHLAVEAGPHAAGHDQADKGTFTLRAYGADLAIDSGYGNDGEPQKSGSSFAHNVVLIDGRGQPMRHHNESSGAITGFRHGSLLDWIRLDAREAWSVRYDRDWTPIPTTPVERAERTLVFVREAAGVPPYVVVADDVLQDGGEHDYTWQWHIPATMEFDAAEAPWRAVPARSTWPVLASPVDGGASAEFRFQVPAAGRFRLAGLVRAGGEESGKSDSFFVAVDGGRQLTWDLRVGDGLAWCLVQDRGAEAPEVFDLAAGAHTIALTKREPQAELARLLLLPEQTPAPSGTAETPAGAIAFAATDAMMGTPPFRLVPAGRPVAPDVTMEVFLARPSGGRVETGWFETSREGSHPRLQYTVRSRDPRFVMVLLPRRPDTPRPEVAPAGEEGAVGVTLRWGQVQDEVHFLRDADSGRTRTTFQRHGAAVAADWSSVPGR